MPKDQTSLLDSTDSPPSSTPPGPTEQGASVTSAPMPKDQANLLLATFSEGLESLKRKYPAATFLRPDHSERRTHVLSNAGVWPVRRADCVLYGDYLRTTGAMPPRQKSSRLPVSDVEVAFLAGVFALGLHAVELQFPEANFVQSDRRRCPPTYVLSNSGTWPVHTGHVEFRSDVKLWQAYTSNYIDKGNVQHHERTAKIEPTVTVGPPDEGPGALAPPTATFVAEQREVRCDSTSRKTTRSECHGLYPAASVQPGGLAGMLAMSCGVDNVDLVLHNKPGFQAKYVAAAMDDISLHIKQHQDELKLQAKELELQRKLQAEELELQAEQHKNEQLHQAELMRMQAVLVARKKESQHKAELARLQAELAAISTPPAAVAYAVASPAAAEEPDALHRDPVAPGGLQENCNWPPDDHSAAAATPSRCERTVVESAMSMSVEKKFQSCWSPSRFSPAASPPGDGHAMRGCFPGTGAKGTEDSSSPTSSVANYIAASCARSSSLASSVAIDSLPQSADGDDEAGCEDGGDNAALHVDALILGATARSRDDSVDVSTRRHDQSAVGSPAEDIAETTCVNLSVDDDCASPVLRSLSMASTSSLMLSATALASKASDSVPAGALPYAAPAPLQGHRPRPRPRGLAALRDNDLFNQQDRLMPMYGTHSHEADEAHEAVARSMMGTDLSTQE